MLSEIIREITNLMALSGGCCLWMVATLRILWWQKFEQENDFLNTVSRPAMRHFSTIRYISRYSFHYTIHYVTTSHNNIALRLARGHRKSVQLTSLVGSTHVFVVSTILNITLNTAQHGFFSSVCSENRRAEGLKSGRRVSTN